MTDCAEKLLVRIGIGVLDKPMTRAQAQRYGEKIYRRICGGLGLRRQLAARAQKFTAGTGFVSATANKGLPLVSPGCC